MSSSGSTPVCFTYRDPSKAAWAQLGMGSKQEDFPGNSAGKDSPGKTSSLDHIKAVGKEREKLSRLLAGGAE